MAAPGREHRLASADVRHTPRSDRVVGDSSPAGEAPRAAAHEGFFMPGRTSADVEPLLGALLAVPLIVAAAKAHGREVRLERERAGYREVVFGGANPAFVEALWRRDRRRFWGAFPLLGGVVMLAAHAVSFPLAPPWRGGSALAFLVVALAWPFAAAFVCAGARSMAAKMRERRDDAALRGSLAWWGLTGALAAADAWLLL